MKLTEELVDLIGCIVADELVPEGASFHLAGLTFVIVDDLLEVPREGENVCVLLLIENSVDTESLVSLIQLNSVFLLLLYLKGSREVSIVLGQDLRLSWHDLGHDAA